MTAAAAARTETTTDEMAVATLEPAPTVEAKPKPARKPRKKKAAVGEGGESGSGSAAAAPIQEEQESAAPKLATCGTCSRELTWQDYFYAGADTAFCKGCHARVQRVKLRGTYVKQMQPSARKGRPIGGKLGPLYHLEMRHWAAYRRAVAAR